MSDGFDTHTHGTFLDRGCQNCKRLEKNITLEQVYSEDLLQTGAELEARVAELEGALREIAFGLPEPQSLAKCRFIAKQALGGDDE